MTFYTVALQTFSRESTRKRTFVSKHIWDRQDFTSKQKSPKIRQRFDRDISPRSALGLRVLYFQMVFDSFVCPCVLSCRLRRVHNLDFESLTSLVRRPSPAHQMDPQMDSAMFCWFVGSRHASIYHLMIQFPQFMFNVPVNDRYVALSHKTIKQWSWRRQLTRSCQGWILFCCEASACHAC